MRHYVAAALPLFDCCRFYFALLPLIFMPARRDRREIVACRGLYRCLSLARFAAAIVADATTFI